MKKLLFSIIFFVFSVFANTLPELGSTFDNLLSISDQKKIKFQIMNQIYSNSSVIRDPEINDYISSLGKNLIVNGSDQKPNIYFFVQNDDSINAFAMLGDIIGVHTGLIMAANSESELASVLSHEIAHITQKHLLRLFDNQAKNSYKTFLSMAFAILVARSNPQLASGILAAGNASQTQSLLDYTRENEKEADRIGLTILEKSGFDPKGALDFFSTLQSFNEFSSGPAPSFLRTHPITSDRISDIQDRLNDYDYFQKSNSEDFYLIKAKLKALNGDSYSSINYFRNQINSKQNLDMNSYYFGITYSLLVKNKIKEARENFEKLVDSGISSPMLIELHANLLIKEKKYQEAFDLYRLGLNKYPLYRAFIFGMSNLLLQSNQSDKVIELLSNYLSTYDKDSIFYELLAKAHNQKRNYLLEHENLSDAYYFQFDIQNAISQMDLATKTNSEDFFEKSRVEHRLKELRKEAELMNN